MNDTALFVELWRERTAEEQAVLRELATAGPPALAVTHAVKELVDVGLVEHEGDGYRVAVPLFATWIRARGESL